MCLSCTVNDIGVTLKSRSGVIQGYLKWQAQAPFECDRSHDTSSYSSSIVTMATSYTVFDIKTDILVENASFSYSSILT